MIYKITLKKFKLTDLKFGTESTSENASDFEENNKYCSLVDTGSVTKKSRSLTLIFPLTKSFLWLIFSLAIVA